MPEDTTPKIILNEEFLDLRKYPDTTTTVSIKKSQTRTNRCCRRNSALQKTRNLSSNDGIRLINSGLKKLANSYNATASFHQRQDSPTLKRKGRVKEKSMVDPRFRRLITPEEKPQLKSQSELSVLTNQKEFETCGCPSTPVFQSKKTSSIEIKSNKNKSDAVKNKFTMTKNDKEKGSIAKPRRKAEIVHCRSKSKDFNDKADFRLTTPVTPKDYVINRTLNRYLDPRLCEKYSVLKLPWKRTWTLPVFSPRTSATFKNNGVDFDRQTYLYDDGTEIDSVFVEEKRKQFFSKAFQNQCMAILFLGGSICGILLVSLLIWFIFGNNFFNFFFKPRQLQEGAVKKSIKYMGGSIIYVVATLFKTIGRVLALPTQTFYQSQPELYRWPIHPVDQY